METPAASSHARAEETISGTVVNGRPFIANKTMHQFGFV
jgi:hypothetical protein